VHFQIHVRETMAEVVDDVPPVGGRRALPLNKKWGHSTFLRLELCKCDSME
jgi:hypothetical protein